jgi:hypothetical protein
LAAYARKRTQNGKELVNFMLGVMRGQPLPVRATRNHRARYPQTPKVEHRMVAAQWLADRGWGRAKEIIELLDDRPGVDRRALIAALSAEDRATLERLVDLALARAAQAQAGPVIDMPAASMLPEAQHGSDPDPA